MATNGLPDELMQCCHGWWRQINRRFCNVSCLPVVFLSCSCSLRQYLLCSVCLLCCGAASRHATAFLVTSRLRFIDVPRVWLLHVARMNGTMATNALRDERMQFCHDWWRLCQHRFCKVSCLFVVFSPYYCSTRQCVLCSACFLFVVLLHGTAPRNASRHGAAAVFDAARV